MLAARGLTSHQIASQLLLSVRTVEHHLQHAYEKLGITRRQQLADALADLQSHPRVASHSDEHNV
jgi:DNA-binding NarL/FixJ family response regulator